MRCSFILSFIFSIVSFKLIPGYILEKPFNIHNTVSDFHVRCINNAAEDFNSLTYFHGMTIQFIDKCDAYCNQIQYTNNTDRVGYTEIYGFHNGKSWYNDETNIYISPSINYFNTCYNVMIHEFLHSKGLDHSIIKGSIMNNSIHMYTDGTFVMTDKWLFSLDDLWGLIFVDHVLYSRLLICS